MARKRENKRALPLKDHHLWVEVTRTVRPLRPSHARPDPASLLAHEPARTSEATSAKTGAPARIAPASPNMHKRLRPSGASSQVPQPSGQPGANHTFEAALRAAQPIEPRLKRRLQRGHLPIDATLDLHGMRQAEAHAALNRFIAARAARGDRTVLVITGKGLKSAGDGRVAQRGVLREMLPRWLAQGSLAALVSGWEISAQAHGGEGAFYVRLKRPRP